MKHLADLIYWVEEREAIRIRKEDGFAAPWTEDPILAAYRFCNVRREDDKVTRWIYHNWYRPMFGDDRLPFAVAVARMVNLPHSLARLGFPYGWNEQEFIRELAHQKSLGNKVWTSAYMITGGYSKGGEAKEVIIGRVLNQLYKQLQKDPVTDKDTLEVASYKVATPGIGSFLRGQIVADLKMVDMPLYRAPDWETWCAVGPGSTAGLNYLHGREHKYLGEFQFREEVNRIRQIIDSETGITLCAQNTQNCLCEFSKFVRTKYYGGRPKAKYYPAP